MSLSFCLVPATAVCAHLQPCYAAWPSRANVHTAFSSSLAEWRRGAPGPDVTAGDPKTAQTCIHNTAGQLAAAGRALSC